MNFDSNDSDLDTQTADADIQTKDEGKPTKPTFLSILKDILIVSSLVFALLVAGWALLPS